MALYEFGERRLYPNSFLTPKRIYPKGTSLQIEGSERDRHGKGQKVGIINLFSEHGSGEGMAADPRLGGTEHFHGFPDVIDGLSIISSFFKRLHPYITDDEIVKVTTPYQGSELNIVDESFRIHKTGIFVVKATVQTPNNSIVQDTSI